MPELPEVEHGRKLAEAVAAGRVIETVRCARDDIVFDGVAPARVTRVLRGRQVVAVRRHGKHLWFELDRPPWPCFHFGMTGAFVTPGCRAIELASSPARPRAGDAAWPPRFTRIRLRFDDGGELVMTNKRRLGRIRLRDDPPGEPPISKLGFDPLLDLPSPAEFSRRLRRRSGPLKAILLDQAFAAGVGNWIADEVLYQAKLDPRRTPGTLADTDVRRLRSRLEHVIERAVEADAVKDRFPRTWLFHRRWGKDPDARTAAGHRIEHLTIGGRTTAWVPAVQE